MQDKTSIAGSVSLVTFSSSSYSTSSVLVDASSFVDEVGINRCVVAGDGVVDAELALDIMVLVPDVPPVVLAVSTSSEGLELEVDQVCVSTLEEVVPVGLAAVVAALTRVVCVVEIRVAVLVTAVTAKVEDAKVVELGVVEVPVVLVVNVFDVSVKVELPVEVGVAEGLLVAVIVEALVVPVPVNDLLALLVPDVVADPVVGVLVLTEVVMGPRKAVLVVELVVFSGSVMLISVKLVPEAKVL